MMRFHKNLLYKTLDVVKNSYDCADVLNDLNRIDRAIERVQLFGDLNTAYNLNIELLQKYPSITAMNKVADSIPVLSPQPPKQYTIYESVIESLNNDRYGILCGVAVKKGIVHSIKDLIKTVD